MWSLKTQKWFSGCVSCEDLIVEIFLGEHVFLSQDSSWCIINSSQCAAGNRESEGSNRSEGIEVPPGPWCVDKFHNQLGERGRLISSVGRLVWNQYAHRG